jgi:hypothetical protein
LLNYLDKRLDSTPQIGDEPVVRILELLLGEVMSNMDWPITLEKDKAIDFFLLLKITPC